MWGIAYMRAAGSRMTGAGRTATSRRFGRRVVAYAGGGVSGWKGPARVAGGAGGWAWWVLVVLMALTGQSLAHVVSGGGRAAGTTEVTVRVETGRVVRRGADRVVGVNLNYLRDADVNRAAGARPLAEALSEMGVRMVRYPGGEKSNFHVWSSPPYDRPRPQSLEWYAGVAGERLDFDALMGLARDLRFEPFVVVGLDGTPRSGRTPEQWLADAVAWVRYSNLDRRYGVRWWEVGNENWSEGKRTPEETGKLVRTFARAMKAVDPSIRVGASGRAGSEAWWRPFLAEAGEFIDFATISLYNTYEWKSYDRLLREPETDLLADVRAAFRWLDTLLPPGKAGRLPLVIAETNSRDYSQGGWEPLNNFGHAVVTFETLARLAGEERVEGAMVWTTRWVDDAQAYDDQMYALGPLNELTATGRAVQLWGAFARTNVVVARVDGGDGSLRAYASVDAETRDAVVWLVNRGARAWRPRLVVFAGDELAAWRAGALWQLAASGPDDRRPTWQRADELAEHGGGADAAIHVALSPFSITVVQLTR